MRGERIRDRGLPPPSRPPDEGREVFDNFSVAGLGRFRMVSRLSESLQRSSARSGCHVAGRE